MAFSPVSLPIQEILLTNFVTDIATISNANDLLLQDKLEDLLNILEIDINALSIGTDNPISFVRAQSFIIQDTGLTFQTGNPTQIIARLEKNLAGESVLTVNNINVDSIAGLNELNVNDVTVDASFTTTPTAPAVFNASLEFKAASIESKETVLADLIKDTTTDASARITLTNTSRKNIFVKLKASTAPTLDSVYDGISAFGPFVYFYLYIDFDATNPPAQNTVFNIYLVDVISEAGATIRSFIDAAAIPIMIRGGENLNAAPVVPVYLHNDLSSYELGINPSSSRLGNYEVTSYGHSLSVMYILDENTNDRLVVTGMTGLEFFTP